MQTSDITWVAYLTWHSKTYKLISERKKWLVFNVWYCMYLHFVNNIVGIMSIYQLLSSYFYVKQKIILFCYVLYYLLQLFPLLTLFCVWLLDEVYVECVEVCVDRYVCLCLLCIVFYSVSLFVFVCTSSPSKFCVFYCKIT